MVAQVDFYQHFMSVWHKPADCRIGKSILQFYFCTIIILFLQTRVTVYINLVVQKPPRRGEQEGLDEINQ